MMLKATPQEIELHNQLIAGEDTAFARLCDGYLKKTIQKLKEKNVVIHRTDETLIPDVVTDSFYNYLYNPEIFNPEKLSLEKFLIMNAKGDLINAWQGAKKHRTRFSKIKANVEIDEEDGNNQIQDPSDGTSPMTIMINKESEQILNSELELIFNNKKDIEIAHLILSKERETKVFAQILNVSHLSFPQQQEEVKRNKDRIKKVLDRKLKGKNIN